MKLNLRVVTLALAASLGLAACAPRAVVNTTAQPRWVGTWAAAWQLTERRNMPPAPGLANNTFRENFRVSIPGTRVRVHFSNQYGDGPMELRSVHLAKYLGGGAIDPATDKPLTFAGATSVTIPAGQEVVSDPMGFEVASMADLALTIAFGAVPGDLTGHPSSRMTSYLHTGDAVAAATMEGAIPTEHWYAMTSLDVVAAEPAAAVGVLGNSITDGRGSTTNGNDRWPDMLSRRLRADPKTSQVAVLNLGTGGNCVLRACLGPAGVERFPRQVLDQPGIRWVIIYEGVNDIGGARGAAQADSVAQGLISGYQRMIKQAHERGLKIYGATITPIGGSMYWSPDHERARTTVNEWVRTSKAFDAVIDFDAAVRDPADPTKILPELDNDHLHLNQKGYQVMGEKVDLDLFSRR